MSDLSHHMVSFNIGSHEISLYYEHTHNGPDGPCYKCSEPSPQKHLVITEVIDRGVVLNSKSPVYRRAVELAQKHLGHGKHVCFQHDLAFAEEFEVEQVPDIE